MKRLNKKKAEQLIRSGAVLVDMRSPVAYRDGHIKGAINLPLKNFLNHLMKLDKKTTVVIYGESPDDPDLKRGTNYGETIGYYNIFTIDYNSLK